MLGEMVKIWLDHMSLGYKMASQAESRRTNTVFIVAFVIVGLLLVGTLTYAATQNQVNSLQQSIEQLKKQVQTVPAVEKKAPATEVKFVLSTAFGEKGFSWVGKEGASSGKTNPDLQVNKGDKVTIQIINDDGVEHALEILGLGVKSESVIKKGDTQTVTFTADKEGTYQYVCNIPGHKEAGMLGKLTVGGEDMGHQVSLPQVTSPKVILEAPKAVTVPDIAQLATNVPAPITRRASATVNILLETREVVAKIAGESTYTYWTYNGTVPGPLIRVREGDTVVLTIKNLGSQPHSIDLHAVNGPGGGAVLTQTQPGGLTTFKFKAINPGVYLYHCASPHIPSHIANGMYGLIVVEPEEGLPKVDREFYVVQGELYSAGTRGQVGHHPFGVEKALDERPEFVVFNGRVGALTDKNVMKAKVGETVRIYFGNAGPNLISSFHVIGEIFDRVYPGGGLGKSAVPDVNAETIAVPAGSGTIVEFTIQVPGNLILVDHSIFRAIDKGAVGIIAVEGADAPSIFAKGN